MTENSPTAKTIVSSSPGRLTPVTGETGVVHGVHFLFCDPPPDARGPRLTKLLADSATGRTLPLWGESVELDGARIEGHKLLPITLACVASDKDVYRAGDDTVTLVIVDPAHPDEERTLEVSLAGRPFRKWTVRLDWNGMAVQSFTDLAVGPYEASCGAARTRFEVAGYSLGAMSGGVREAVMKDGKLECTLDLASLARPVSGRVRVVVLENGRVVHGPVELESLDGVLTAAFPLAGEGPFVAHVTGIDDPSLDTQVPLRGTAKKEREGAWLSRLGAEWIAAALKTEGARACRGLWIREEGRNNAPLKLEDPIAEVGRLHARAELRDAVLTLLHPGEGRIQHRALGTVAAGARIEFGVQAPFSVALIGGFVDGRPWEGMASLMPPADLGLTVEVPERAEPRSKLKVTVRTARPRGEASVFLVVRDARLAPMDHPLVQLGTALKTTIAAYDAVPVPRVVARASGAGRATDMKLGDMMIADGFINRAQRDEALARQRRTGARLGQILVQMRVVTDHDVTETLSKQLNTPFIDLSNYIIDPAFAKLVPEHIAQRHQLIPINKVGFKLTVAMVDPLNVLALDDIQLMTGLQVKPVIATPTDVQRALQDTYGAQSQMDRVFGDIEGDLGIAKDSEDLDSFGELSENDAPIIKLVNLILSQAAANGKTRIRIEPDEREVKVYYGAADEKDRLEMTPPKKSQPAISTRFRVLFSMPQGTTDGKVRIKINNRSLELRVRAEPTPSGDRFLILLPDAQGRFPEQAEPAGRERFPEIVFAGLVHVRGESVIDVALGDTLGRLEVDAFALHRGDWEGATRTLEVARAAYGELTLPDLVHADDTVVGRLAVGWSRTPVAIELTRDGAPVALSSGGKPFVAGELNAAGHAALTFPAGPGRWECTVRETGGASDRMVREVASPGVFRGLARHVRLVAPGESLAAEELGALFMRVLPGPQQPVQEMCRVTAGFEHLCCEQTAAKIMAALGAWAGAPDERERSRLSGIVQDGVERERRLWVRGRGMKLYPDDAGVSASWGRVTVERLLSMTTLDAAHRLPPELKSALAGLDEIARDLAGPCGLELVPTQIRSLYDGYRALVHGSVPVSAVLRAVEERLKEAAADPERRGGHGEVLQRVETCHAAATLLRVGTPDALRRALPLVDAIGAQRRPEGAYYSTHDSSAAILMMHELARLSMLGAGGARVRVDGVTATIADAARGEREVARVEALDGPVLVETAIWKTEDWTRFRSNAPFTTRLVRERAGALVPGERVTLELELERYVEGDLAHVCLPPALARITGGGRVQSFSADFAGAAKLAVPLAVVDAGASPRQHWFACLRNMFEEERVGNPGVMELALA